MRHDDLERGHLGYGAGGRLCRSTILLKASRSASGSCCGTGGRRPSGRGSSRTSSTVIWSLLALVFIVVPRVRGAGRPVHALWSPAEVLRSFRLALSAGCPGPDRRPLPLARRLGELATANAHPIRGLATHSRARLRCLHRCDDPRPQWERHTLRLVPDRLRRERGRRGGSGRAPASVPAARGQRRRPVLAAVGGGAILLTATWAVA